jgi:hypothetical protein
LKIQNGLCQLSVKILVIYFRKEILFVLQDKNTDPSVPQITPLLYAGILLEGGIVSYDSNIITGVLVLGILVQEELSNTDRTGNHLPSYGINFKW